MYSFIAFIDRHQCNLHHGAHTPLRQQQRHDPSVQQARVERSLVLRRDDDGARWTILRDRLHRRPAAAEDDDARLLTDNNDDEEGVSAL